MQKISICVYCGSRSGKHPEYAQQAETLGAGIAKRAWRLVYGAGDVGLMGSVAHGAQINGTSTFGVIPNHLLEEEVGKTDLTNFIITENMHELSILGKFGSSNFKISGKPLADNPKSSSLAAMSMVYEVKKFLEIL